MRFRTAEFYSEEPDAHAPFWRRQRNLVRFVIFLFVFLVGSGASLFYVFDRSPIYESRASVLITPPDDERGGSADGAALSGGETPSSGLVGVERYQLLANPLLNSLLDQLRQEGLAGPGVPANLEELRGVISAERFEATNIVTLQASGSNPEILPVIVNRWLELYQKSQAKGQQTSASETNERLTTQVEALQERIARKRSEIEEFRNRHDIVSMERDENRLLARLNGLTASLNAAKEEEVNAQGYLNAVTAAQRSGEPVTELQDQRRMANLEQRLVELEEQIKELELRFTKRYMELDPDIQTIYRQRDLVQERIVELRLEASDAVVAAARQRLASARTAVWGLSEEFESSKRQIAAFTARFAEHEALVNELEEMEVAYRQTRDEQLRREVNVERGITKVQVLENAVQPSEPVWPDYNRDAGIGLGGSFVLGILTVLLFDFFTRPAASSKGDFGVEILHGTLAQPAPMQTLENRTDMAEQIEAGPKAPALSYRPDPVPLDEADLEALVAASNGETRLLLGFLLSGMALDEIIALRRPNIDTHGGFISIGSQPPRAIQVPDLLRDDLERLLSTESEPNGHVWCDQDGRPLEKQDLEALIAIAAHDAGLAEPELVTSERIFHSYLIYLVEQGMRLADLEAVAGPMAPRNRMAYAAHSPPGSAVPLDQIDRVHPALWKAHAG